MTDLSSVIAASIIQASSHPHKLSTYIQVTGIAYEKKKKTKKLSKHNVPNGPSPKQLANLKNPGVELPISVYKQVLKHAQHSSAYAIPICLCSYPFFHSKV